jgi:ribosomal-protein-alanine N-acetyltransferase
MSSEPTISDVFGDLPTIETERLRLRKIRLEDVDDVYEYTRDPEVARHTSWPPHGSREVSAGFVASLVEDYAKGELAPWGVELKAEGKLLGTCGFIAWHARHRKAEIGYAMHRGYWGRGLMTEAVRAVVDFGFERMALHRVEALCDTDNVGSYRVMEKAGMAFEGVLRGYIFSKGAHRDLRIHAVLRPDWEAARSSSSSRS